MQNKSSSRVFLLLAVVLGILATVTTFAFLESATAKDRGPRVAILVAARDLKTNHPIDPDRDLKEMAIPADMLDLRQRALSPEHKASYRNQRVNRRVLAGTPVMLADLAMMTDIQFTSPESRALSIPAKAANAVSGLLVPGDYVKVFVTRPILRMRSVSTGEGEAPITMPEASGKWEAQLVLPEALKVLAVGPRLSRSRQQITAAEQYERAGESESQQTVTLEVTEAQAKAILENTGAGQMPLTLVLCPPTTQPTR